MGRYRRCTSSYLTWWSFARIRFEIVMRRSAKRPLLVFPQICVKPKQSKVSGLPRPAALAVGRRTAQLDQPRLVGMQFQAELREPVAKLREEPLGLISMLEAHHVVVSKPH